MIIVQLDSEQLSNLIQNAVRKAINENASPTFQPEADQLLTIREAAELIKLSVPTLYGYVSRNTIPFSKKGKKLYFSKSELIEWIKQGRKKTLAEIEASANQSVKMKGA